jgi:hypothetical protein
VFGLTPEKRVERIRSVCVSRLIPADQKSVVESIPKMFWIRIVESSRDSGFFGIGVLSGDFWQDGKQEKKWNNRNRNPLRNSRTSGWSI